MSGEQPANSLQIAMFGDLRFEDLERRIGPYDFVIFPQQPGDRGRRM